MADIQCSLPQIPTLEGEENLDLWKDLLISYLDIFDLARYIVGPIPEEPLEGTYEVSNWKKDRATVLFLIKSNIGPHVYDQVKNHGWDTSNKDPKDLFDMCLRAVANISERDVVREFSEIDRRDFDSTFAFQKRILYLRNRAKEINTECPDMWYIGLVLDGIQESNPELYNLLYPDFESGSLDWARLMAELAELDSVESRPAPDPYRFLTTTPATPSSAAVSAPLFSAATSRPHSSAASSITPFSSRFETEFDCSICKRVHLRDLPLCDACKLHHTGGEKHCPRRVSEVDKDNRLKPGAHNVKGNSNEGVAGVGAEWETLKLDD